MSKNAETNLKDLCYVGLNGRVIAMNRYSGDVVWEWQTNKGRSSFVSMMLDGDRLLVSTNGYIFCLDPVYGQEVWSNPLKGFGTGIVSFATTNGSSNGGPAAQIAAQQAAAASVAATTAATTAATAG